MTRRSRDYRAGGLLAFVSRLWVAVSGTDPALA